MSLIDGASSALKKAVRTFPLRRVRIDKPHPDLLRMTRKFCRRRGLKAADRKVFAAVADAMARHDAEIRRHFARASSSRNSLRLLKDLAELQPAAAILEIGTGYGLSAIALARTARSPRVVTIEDSDVRATIAAANVLAAGARRVECVHGDKAEVIDRLIGANECFDFIFHDGGHRGDDYVRDFALLRRLVKPGTLMVFDDIAWDRKPAVRALTRGKSVRTCREGWDEVVADPAVEWAFAISGRMGVLRISEHR